jgi:hypothetical protein
MSDTVTILELQLRATLRYVQEHGRLPKAGER